MARYVWETWLVACWLEPCIISIRDALWCLYMDDIQFVLPCTHAFQHWQVFMCVCATGLYMPRRPNTQQEIGIIKGCIGSLDWLMLPSHDRAWHTGAILALDM